MTDLEWLNDRLRSIRRVRSNGESEDEDKLVCHMGLAGHFTVEMKVWSLEELIEKGREFERNNLGVKD
jgi:hypothetical protein